MMRFFALLLLVLLGCAATTAEVVEYTFDVREWVVDFKRPTAGKRETPFKIPEGNRKGAILVNGQYPGPTIDVYENDTVRVNVINNMISEDTTIHWVRLRKKRPAPRLYIC